MKCLIFDAGGVLVYPRMGDWNLSPRLAELLGPHAPDIHTAKYLSAHRACLDWLDESRLVNSLEDERLLKRQYFIDMDRRMGWRLTRSELFALADDFTDNTARYAMFPDALTWLTRWQPRYRLGLLSDAMPSLLPALDGLGLSPLLEKKVISTRVGATKPNPRMYQAILQAMEAQPGDCLFVDDRIDNLEGAQAAGIRAVQMARYEFPPARVWDGETVRSFEALNALLEKTV